VTGAPRADLWHSWLPLVLPAAALRFRVSDAGLKATLADAGAELGEEDADVEIAGRVEDLHDAPVVLVPLEARLPRIEFRPLRVAERALASLSLARRAGAARGALRRRGYAHTDVLTWDPGREPAFWGGRGGTRSAVASRFPLRAVAVGRRTVEPTLVEAAAAAAGVPAPERLRAHGGLTLAFAGTRVLRVAVGPAIEKLARQERALDALLALDPAPALAARVPWPLDRGEVGLAHWVVEPMLSGSQPGGRTAERVLDDCVEVLVELFRAGGDAGELASLAPYAEQIAAVGLPEHAEHVRGLGRRVDERVASLPRGFAHGDFWASNLLTDGERLTGVVDWEAAGPGRLPLLDLFQLLAAPSLPAEDEPGDAFVDRLLPAVRAGDRRVAAYCGALGLDLHPELLETLAIAFWLDRVGYSLAHYDAASRWRRDWTERNVVRPVRELARHGALLP
jgi:aminoglycoside phosphotransferase (APT) family kinase protein